jgi:hypothetical protein
MNCFICKDYTYKEKYNIDIDKKNSNIYEVLEIKYSSINENTYVNILPEKNYEKDFQIIEYPEKKNKDNTNKNNDSTILNTSEDNNIRDIKKENFIQSIYILNYKNEKKDKIDSIKNKFMRNFKKDNTVNGNFYYKKPNIIYDEYLNNNQEKEIVSKLNKSCQKIKNFSERIESKQID